MVLRWHQIFLTEAVVSYLEGLCNDLEHRCTDYISEGSFLLCVMVMCQLSFSLCHNNFQLRVDDVLQTFSSMKSFIWEGSSIFLFPHFE